MLALSVSISTSGSPRLTWPPCSTSHLSTVPSSIESDRRGIVTSVAMVGALLEISEGREHSLHHVLLMRHCGLLERLGVGHRRVGPGHPLHRRVEVVERLLLDERRQVRPDAAVRPALLDDHRTIRLLDRLDDGVEVERPQRARIDHLGLDLVLGSERLGGVGGDERLARYSDDRRVVALAADRRLAEADQPVAVTVVGHLALAAIERFML